jgi:hypothetical protein
VYAALSREVARFQTELEAPAEEDPEVRRQLEALGYVGRTAPAAKEGPLPDPKTRLHVLARLEEAHELYRRGDLDAAVSAFRAVLAEEPRLLDAWETLGNALLGLGRREAAIETFRKLLEISDGSAEGAFLLAHALAESGRLEEAAGYAEAAATSVPAARHLLARSGGALLDYDGDGDLDVFLVQGGFLGSGKPADAVVQAPPETPLGARLLRNDLEVLPDGTRRLRFTDVTAEAGLAAASGYGMGAAAGDYDGDGWTDLYVTNFGSNQLWRNRGDGTFEDVTARAGADDPRWSVPAAFLDFDGDGRLDLFVGNYVDFVPANNKPCLGASGARDYCGPAAYAPQPDRLLRNRGDGTFEDVTARAGLLRAYGPALGVVAADLDGDGHTDLYVANDGAPNQLWRNRGDGTFAEEGLLRGCAVNADGRAEAGMGVTAGEADDDGDLDLFLTHLDGETNTFYRNGGGGLFLDRSAASGLGPPSWRSTGFGTRWLDVDNDGWLDLFVANGAVYGVESLVRQRHPWPFGQPNQLFRNLGADGGHRFEEVSAAAGPAFARVEASRGALFGDLDDDGDDPAGTCGPGPGFRGGAGRAPDPPGAAARAHRGGRPPGAGPVPGGRGPRPRRGAPRSRAAGLGLRTAGAPLPALRLRPGGPRLLLERPDPRPRRRALGLLPGGRARAPRRARRSRRGLRAGALRPPPRRGHPGPARPAGARRR